jgi:autotransporter-associated beta strand protein/T5SS/PEP-CTERM-associated repeat protein
MLSALIVVSCALSAANAQDNLWTGSTSTDWNTAANWSLGNVPTGQNAIVDTAPVNIATISADISATPNDIVVRGGGRLDHTAGTAGTGGGSWMFVGQNDTAGTYNLANTGSVAGGITGFAQGTGSLNATGNLLVGAFGDNRTGTVRVNTSGTLAVSGELFVGDSLGSVGDFSLETGVLTVNNKILVGNNRGVGTLTMSGGTLTKTGGDETFVGRDNGTGTLAQSGGTVTLNHNLYVGQGSGANGTYTIGDGAVLNIGRDFVVGRESGTGALTMTGGTITKTGDEKFIVGHNNGVGVVAQSGGTISVNNELYIGNENAGASGTYTLSGAGELNVANEVVVGREDGTGTLNVDGGTITTTGNGNMYIGRRNGTGTLNQTAGVISVIKEFGVGTRDGDKIGIGTYNLSGGSLAATNNIFIGKELGSSGTMTMTGGTMSTSDKLQIGHNQATGVLTQSGGTVNVQNEVYIGNENSGSSVGTYTLSGSAELNVGNEVLVGRDNGTGTFNLDGGTVTTKKIEGGTGNATVNFNGGILKARESQGAFITNLDVANVQAGGITIDNNGFDLGISQTLSGTGGLTKIGSGVLEFSGTATYTGDTTVAAGTLRLANGTALASSRIVPLSGGTVAIAPYLQASVGGLSPNAGGLTDVGSGYVTVAAGLSVADMLVALTAGRGDGSWSGTTGITSSTAANDVAASIPRTVGWLDNGDGSVTFAYAAPGDTNLDWQVDVLDASNFLSFGKYDTGLPATWLEGDFNYDGVVDVLDAADFFGTGLYDTGAYNPPAGAAGAVAAVPEPSSVPVVACGLITAIGWNLRRLFGGVKTSR